MPKTYLVDAENIGPYWKEYIDQTQTGDCILLFYTRNNANKTTMLPDKTLEKLHKKSVRLECIPCTSGHNALDFQLSTELGRLAARDNNREYVILSRDTGYNAVASYLSKQGYKVKRSDPSLLTKAPTNNTTSVKKCRNYYESVCIKAGIYGKQVDIIVDIMLEGMCKPDSDKLHYILEEMQKRLSSQKQATTLYAKLKKSLHEIKANGPYPDKVPTKTEPNKRKEAHK